jgi:hypothetical protein|tara:strand:+ start:383 stop:514 length:132 start_codon:yes stop_codon:yes gene_type:complete
MNIRFARDIKWLISLREKNQLAGTVCFVVGVFLFGFLLYDLIF